MIQKGLLWSISYGDFPTSYIFGTMHVRDNLAFTHIDKALHAMYQCQAFLAEIDLDLAQSSIDPKVYLINDGLTIDSLVTPKRYSKMSKSMRRAFGLDMRSFNRLWPILIINKLGESQLSQDNHVPLDLFLWEKAKNVGLKMGGVESLEEHSKVLTSLDLEIQLQMLKKTLANTAKFKKSMHKLCALYEEQEIHQLHKISKKGMGGMKEVLIYNRNQLMYERIDGRREQSSFYALGAAHLAGKKGVLRLLKNAGYKIKAI